MNKALQKAVMTRSRYKNNYLKCRTVENRNIYKEQRNLCVSLFRKEKKDYFSNLDTKSVTDNKRFWKVIKPSFSDKTSSNESINLIENEEIVSDENELCEIFNKYFGNIVSNLKIPQYEKTQHINTEDLSDPVSIAIKAYQNHPSVIAIQNTLLANQTFSFGQITIEDIIKEITNLDPSKASQENDVPTKIIKENSDILSHFIYNNYNYMINKGTFPYCLKTANITPIFKNKEP